MIPNTFPYYIFIRASIWALRSVAPASIIYCFAQLAIPVSLPWPVEAIARIEALFYLFVSLPRQRTLNGDRPCSVQRSQQERLELFERSWGETPDLASVVRTWFKGAPLDEIYRGNLKDLFSCVLLYEPKASARNDDELELYVRRTEEVLGVTFPPGRGPRDACKVSTDTLSIQHRPLLFYALGVGADDLMTYIKAKFYGLDHYRLPLSKFFTVFPFRPCTLFSRYTSSSRQLSYFYRPHTSEKTLPVLFIYGIGAGMRTYTSFLRDFIKADGEENGQTGIIALELMPISMRITSGMPTKDDMLREILRILDHHGWDRFVIMGHSYGTIIATHLLHHLKDTKRVGPMVLVDPVTLSMQWGDIPYNFLYRHPRKASEWQLHYFASTDMCVAHSMTRRFDWSVNVMWKDDMKGRTMTVALAGQDIIMSTVALHRYLADDESLSSRSLEPADILDRKWEPNDGNLDIVWYDELNHSEMFEDAKQWAPLVKVLQSYCRRLE